MLDLNLVVQSGGRRHGFDLLNDALGMVLIAGGVIALTAERVDGLYDWLMGVTSAVAIVFTIGSFLKQLDPEWLDRLGGLMTFFGLLGLAATIAFCVSMQSLASTFSAPAVERSWRITTVTFALLVVLPGAILMVVALLTHGGMPFLIYPSILVTVGYGVALVHMFLSTWRMSTHAKTHGASPVRRTVL